MNVVDTYRFSPILSRGAGSENGELEVGDHVRPGMIQIPKGFGLIYDGRVDGINVNRLTKNTHRDPMTGTPLHRFVPCRGWQRPEN